MGPETIAALVAGAIAVAAAVIKLLDKVVPARTSLPAVDAILKLQREAMAPALDQIGRYQSEQIALHKETLALQRQLFQSALLTEERHKAHVEQTTEIKRQLLAHVDDERESLRVILEAVRYRNGG